VHTSRLFQDRHYGGRLDAQKAAEQFAASLGPCDTELLALLRRFLPRKNTRSGIPGVSRLPKQRNRGPTWLAYWNDGARKVQKRFSVKRHGEDEARQLAISARLKAMESYIARFEELAGKQL
jgi:hypothetical protein